MNEEIKKYGFFDVWGTFAGFVVGVLVIIVDFLNMYYEPAYSTYTAYINPVAWITWLIVKVFPIVTMLGVFVIVVTTPFVFALYGWGIHSLFRKFSR